MTAAPLASMTGFARAAGGTGATTWVWEIKSVNGKGLDLRLRLPQGLDTLEAEARARVGASVRRGSVQATLTAQRPPLARTARVNRPALEALIAALGSLPSVPFLRPPSLDGLLAVPGIVDVVESADQADATPPAAVLTTLDEALAQCSAMRRHEGERLGAVLRERLASIGRLVAAAEASPARSPETVRAKLAQRIADLAGAMPALDPTRLHAEAVLLAAKADVREELDRLAMHVAAVAELLAEGGPVGRRLDFLAQELGREASTLCAKSSDGALTLIGLDLRTEIEQFREQVQNLE